MSNLSQGGRVPTVFISSTCYDLAQLRADLKYFVEDELGLEALLSEYNSFPLSPEMRTVDNCLKNVKERADIFILVIGGRYGSIVDGNKSVTNLEYLQACTKKIPIYIFVDRTVLSSLPLWKDNPDGNFFSIVDSVELFKFVDALKNTDSRWVYGFNNAQDIINTLRKQMAYLFFDCLRIHQKFYDATLPSEVNALEGKAFRYALEKPDGWEYLLLGELLEVNIKKYTSLKYDLINNLSLSNFSNRGNELDMLKFVGGKFDEILHTTASLTSLINNAFQDALGAPGEPGDVGKIVYVAERLGLAYKNVIEWGLNFSTANAPEDYHRLINACRKVSLSTLSNVEQFCEHYQKEMKKLPLYEELSQTEPITIRFTLTLEAPDLHEIKQEITALGMKYAQ